MRLNLMYNASDAHSIVKLLLGTRLEGFTLLGVLQYG